MWPLGILTAYLFSHLYFTPTSNPSFLSCPGPQQGWSINSRTQSAVKLQAPCSKQNFKDKMKNFKMATTAHEAPSAGPV